MNLFFFTAADDNCKREAEILIASGKRFGREIHFFDIPEGEMPERYKVKLLADPDLPKADKYIYIDSDAVMTGPGDWEDEECQGVADIFYNCPEQRLKQTMGLIRNNTTVVGEVKGYEFFCELWRLLENPVFCNSGVTVLTDKDRLPFMTNWLKWMEMIDGHCQRGYFFGDEAPLMFARHFFDLPFLPPRFNGLCKWQPIYEWHVLIHADGNVTGEKRLPYTNAVERILDGQEKAKD